MNNAPHHALLFPRAIVAGLALLASACGNAADVADPAPAALPPPAVPVIEVSDERLAEVRAAIVERMPELATAPLRPTPIEGLYEVRVGVDFAYVTGDGRFVIEGDLIDVAAGVAVTQAHRKAARAQILAELDLEAIEFMPPATVPLRHVVTVFTDIDCGYCRRLHREVDSYLQRGIGIRYLFYPRSGPDTEAWRKAEGVWCQRDRHQALTAAKRGGKVAAGDCTTPVAAHYRLGQLLGIRGTPMLVLPDGDVVQGYLPAEVLEQRLVAAAPLAEPLPSLAD